MSGRFPAAWLEELRAKADIIQVVGSYVALKKNGRSYVGLCPFHHEKSPSFYVDEQKQLFYCFGCKVGGTVFQFIMEMENLSFYEAVKLLADQMGVPLPEMENDPYWEQKRSLKERIYQLNKEAARLYHAQLWTPEGKQVLSYLQGRGLSDAVIRRFGLGASLPSARAGKQLSEMGFTQDELIQAGFLRTYEDAPPRDMFRNRAMFPIIDAWGNVLGFGGRTMADEQPKYLNTKDTPVFNKRFNVYAANLLRKEKHLPYVILVEGYMDVVAMSQFGIKGVAATLGTSLTVEQAQLLKRYAPEVHLCYDGDSAGQNAILRGLGIMEEAGVSCQVIDLPGGLDPDEFIRQEGAEAFLQLKRLSPTQYRMLREKEKHDLSTEKGKTDYAIRSAEFIRKIPDPVEAENHLKRLALETGYSLEVLRSQVGQRVASQPNVPIVRRSFSPKAEKPASLGKRAQEVLLSLLATGKLPSSQIRAEWFEDGLERNFAESLLSGVKPVVFLDGLTDAEDRNRVVRWLSLIGEEEDSTMMKMAHQALQTLKEQALQSKIGAVGDDLSLETAAQMLEDLKRIQ